jgi:hypothetical protein
MSENCFFETELNIIKDILDKMSDVIANDNILNRNKLLNLSEYIKNQISYIVNDVTVHLRLK